LAVLNNIQKNISIVLNLKLTEESSEWIGYELIIFDHKNNKVIPFLVLDQGNILTLENCYEPEVPSLYNGLNLLVEKKVSFYEFEPIDEKDFLLEIKEKRDFYTVNLFMRNALLLDTYHWESRGKIGVQVYVNADSIAHFSKSLQSEYLGLVKRLPGSTF